MNVAVPISVWWPLTLLTWILIALGFAALGVRVYKRRPQFLILLSLVAASLLAVRTAAQTFTAYAAFSAFCLYLGGFAIESWTIHRRLRTPANNFGVNDYTRAVFAWFGGAALVLLPVLTADVWAFSR